MAHDVTMPQLGMTQDSGIILSWAKALGDPVKSGEVLMEVETDKATMEVEATNDGFLTEIRAPAGSDVPVGNVVAVISANAGDIVTSNGADETPVSNTDKQPLEPQKEEVLHEPVPSRTVEPSQPANRAANGKILASPKAKQEARNRGIKLESLVGQGGVQPFHFADIINATPGASNQETGNQTVSAKLSRKALTAFQAWLADELGWPLDIGFVLAAFASGALRACGGADVDAPLQCDIKSHRYADQNVSVTDADRCGLANQTAVNTETDGRLIIYDLTDSALTGFSPSLQPGQIAIVLTLPSRKKLQLHCHYHSSDLPDDMALSFTSDLAGRLSQPLCNLL
jgi:hypothetical protein